MNRSKRFAIASAILAATAAGSALVFNGTNPSSSSVVYAQQAAESTAAQAELLAGPEKLSEAFRSAAKVVRPSVVTITSMVQRQTVQFGGGGMRGIPPEFRRMFPEGFFDDLENQAPRGNDSGAGESVQSGVGSGVIVSADGIILTNNHVVDRADSLQVRLSDGRTFDAEVVGKDAKSDVAVLRIDASGLVPAQLGDSSSMDVGDWVIAVGSPFGLDQTVTAGIISATNRQTGIITGGYEDFLQTDAAINPGNSGGPLVNLRGEVVGINTAINSRTGSNAGVGFAIPANMAARIMEDLISSGKVVRGFIGATLANVTSENAAALDLPNGMVRGAVIERVMKDGPAFQGNLQPGDVVVGLNGRDITSFLQLRNQVAMTRPGEQLTLDIYRGGKPMKLTIKVGEMTQDKLAELSGQTAIESLGITVEQVTPQISEQLGLSEDTSGVVVTSLERDGRGAELGIRPGDVIIEVNGNEVSDGATVNSLLDEGGDEFRMIIQRGNQLLMLRSSNG